MRARFFSLISLWSRPLRPGDGDDAVVEHLFGEGGAEFDLQFFRLWLHDRAAFLDVGGDDVAAERNDRRVADDAFVEDGDVGGAAADVHQGHAGLFFLFGEGGVGTGDGFEGEVGHFQARLFDAAEHVVDRRDLSGDDVEIGFQPDAAHPDRIGDALLAVHGEFLREHVDDLVAGWQHEFEHVIDNAVNVAAGDLGMVALAGQDAAVLQAFDVLAGNADVHGAKFHARIALGNLDGFADGVDRFFDVADHAAQYADAFDLADAEDFELAMVVFAPGQATHFRGANVQRDDHIVGLWE